MIFRHMPVQKVLSAVWSTTATKPSLSLAATHHWTKFKYTGTVITGGGVTYNASGRGETDLAVGASDTLSHTITIPGGGTNVTEARLYVYWYDWANYKTYPEGRLADLSVDCQRTSDGTWLNFTNAMGTRYTDAKGFEKYHSPKGTYAYNVTSLVAGSGDYDVTLTNTGTNITKPFGTLLLVVYENANAHKTTQLWWLEGNDYMMAADETHGSYKYHVSPEEATATATFAGAVNNPADVTKATLLSVVAQGHTAGIDMLFNGAVIEEDAWNVDSEACPDSRVHIESKDVTLVANDNTMGFKDTGSNGMQAVGAFLIVCTDTQNVSTCDASGNVKTSFLEGEDMYVMGSGLAVGNYSVYIQPEPVELGETLVAGDDPSTTQEWINTTVLNQNFGPTEIWHNISRPGGITFEEWDVVLDKENGGTYSADDGITSACKEGGVAPVPEFATIALFGMGLLTLVGYVYLGRRRKRA